MKQDDFSIKNRPKKLRDLLTTLVVFAVALVCFVFLITNFNSADTNMEFHNRFEYLPDDWRIHAGDSDVETTLPHWVDINPGESFTLKTTIPDMDSPHATMVLMNYHLRLSAYIDGEQIYSFPRETQVHTDSVITNDWNMIYIPQDAAGKEITLKFYGGLAGFNGYISPVLFGEDNAILASLRLQYVLPYILGMTLVVIGILLIAVSTVYNKSFVNKSHFLLSFIFIAVGIWFSDRSRMPILIVGSSMKFFVAFSVLALVPLLLTLYAGDRFPEHNQTVINILTVVDIVLAVSLYLVVMLRIKPVHAIIQYVYLTILVSCIYLVYLMWYHAFGKGHRWLNPVQLNSARIEFLSAIITIAMSILSILIDAVTSNNWSSSHREWSGIGNMQMFAVIIFAFFHLIVILYNSYYGVLESESVQKKLHDSQLQLMMGQIQPHFMFNTLSSIRTLIKVNPDVAYDMVYDFSNYLRANVDNLTNMDGIQFSAEVSHIESYVAIEKVRFGSRLNVEYDIQESEFMVPPLSIQPLVENAIKHGVCKRPEGGTVWLRSYRDGTDYIVEVQDDGVGIAPERLESILSGGLPDNESGGHILLTGNGSEDHKSTGMRNIITRLKEMSNATLEITSEVGKGTMIKVIFPQK